jgi:hypothetical protein
MKSKYFPIFVLLVINLLIGILTFKDYGLAWDEPLYYDYAESIGYAYSPHEWFSGDFDLENAFGPSASDHANRGPAYLLIARGPAALLQNLGLDRASAWHLINFLTFQIGVFVFYLLCLRWLDPWPSTATTAFFSWQPLLWGHAFINSKDIPSIVFFILSIWSGLVMVDSFFKPRQPRTQVYLVIAAGVLLGFLTCMRVIGPLAGILIIFLGITRYFLRQHSPSSITPSPIRYFTLLLLLYPITSLLITILTWPYLWPDPLNRFIDVIRFMSANPTQLAVLFQGQILRSDLLPRRYLPTLLGLTLTEPLWPLFGAGLILSFIKVGIQAGSSDKKSSTPEKENPADHPRNPPSRYEYGLAFAWFFIPVLYVIIRTPPMYDGFRHFLFILPPVFLFAGFTIQVISKLLKPRFLKLILLSLLLMPGILIAGQLHPYEYTYYNSLTGWTGGAFRSFETDYWLTCYKEAIVTYQTGSSEEVNIFVKREPHIAAYYANERIKILDYRSQFARISPGDLILVNSRSNEDLQTFRDSPSILTIGRTGANFCLLKKVQ